MDARGWIKLYRQIWNSDIWKSPEPFDKRSAWIDMVLLANHADADFNVDDKTVIHVQRGQFVTSIRHLADRWLWSKDKVSRWLRHLSRHDAIHITATRTATLITLVKYDFYQGECDTDKDTERDTGKHTSKSQTRRKEINNEHTTRKDVYYGAERDEYHFRVGSS